MDVSVAICTYNGADRIPEVLDHLLVQQGVDEVRWEVIVVDNNSSDDTKDVVRHYQPHWLDDVPLRYGFERRQGKSYAMEQAIDAARGTWVAFLETVEILLLSFWKTKRSPSASC